MSYLAPLNTMIEPNWDYFINAPLDQGVIRFETKPKGRFMPKLYLANWMECQSNEHLAKW